MTALRDNVQLVINTKTWKYSAGDVSDSHPPHHYVIQKWKASSECGLVCLCQTDRGKINKTRARTELLHDVSRTPARKQHVPHVFTIIREWPETTEIVFMRLFGHSRVRKGSETHLRRLSIQCATNEYNVDHFRQENVRKSTMFEWGNF